MHQLSCSIITSVRNCFSETKQCLESPLNHYDDASDEETAKSRSKTSVRFEKY